MRPEDWDIMREIAAQTNLDLIDSGMDRDEIYREFWSRVPKDLNCRMHSGNGTDEWWSVLDALYPDEV